MALKTIHVDEIPEKGLQVSCELEPQELELTEHDVRIQDRLALHAGLARVVNGVRVTGELRAVFIRQCVRCLLEYPEAARIPLDVEYRRKADPGVPVKGNPRAVQAGEVLGLEGQDDRDIEDEDIYPFSGERVELAPMLREQVILAIPMQPLCHPECRGLCPVCGQNRNERRCVCPDEPQQSPFAALKAYMDRRSNE